MSNVSKPRTLRDVALHFSGTRREQLEQSWNHAATAMTVAMHILSQAYPDIDLEEAGHLMAHNENQLAWDELYGAGLEAEKQGDVPPLFWKSLADATRAWHD